MRKQNVIVIDHMLLRNSQIDSISLVSLLRYGAGPQKKVSRLTTRKSKPRVQLKKVKMEHEKK